MASKKSAAKKAAPKKAAKKAATKKSAGVRNLRGYDVYCPDERKTLRTDMEKEAAKRFRSDHNTQSGHKARVIGSQG